MTITCKDITRKAEFKDKDFERNYQTTYQLLTDSNETGRLAVASTLCNFLGVSVVPWEGGTFFEAVSGEFDDRARLISMDVVQSDQKNPRKWMGTCQWSTKSADEKKQAEKPNLKPPRWTGNGRIEDKPVVEDVLGVAVLNSAGLPFQSGLIIGSSLQTHSLEINRSFADFPTHADVIDHISLLINKCNSADWGPFDARNLCCDSIRYSEEFESDTAFWKMNYEFSQAPADQPDRTIQKFLDMGFEEVLDDGPPKTYRRIRDKLTGQPLSVPSILKDGRLWDNTPPKPYLTFTVRKTQNFGIIL